jgi:hypothetical protein
LAASGGFEPSSPSKWRELRASTSLARLTDRRNEARAMLAEINGWFTEGFDRRCSPPAIFYRTPELPSAAALRRIPVRRIAF